MGHENRENLNLVKIGSGIILTSYSFILSYLLDHIVEYLISSVANHTASHQISRLIVHMAINFYIASYLIVFASPCSQCLRITHMPAT